MAFMRNCTACSSGTSPLIHDLRGMSFSEGAEMLHSILFDARLPMLSAPGNIDIATLRAGILI